MEGPHITSGIMRGSFHRTAKEIPMARASLRTVHLSGKMSLEAVCIVGHSKNTAMQELMIPQDWGPYSECGCRGTM